jgi:DNA topoisomerase-1
MGGDVLPVEELAVVEEVLVTDPVEAARQAHLHYVHDDAPGISRRRRGKGFSYYDPSGRPIADEKKRRWLNSLAIPPAWTDVWICTRENCHILATGRDEKGRKQYIYHPRWDEIRNENKFNRMLLFAAALPEIRARVDQDLRRRGLPRERIVATLVRLLEKTLIRIGNREYARQNNSFGLTTLQMEHLNVNGSTLHFEFRGKSGKWHGIDVRDPRAARVIRQCQELPGQELFQYLDDEGQSHKVGSADINDYLRAITGRDFTAKDFRTWGGTIRAVQAFRELGPAESKTEKKKKVVACVKLVAAELGNTTTVCRKYYIHPAVLQAYDEGWFFDAVQAIDGGDADGDEFDADERLVVAIIKRYLALPGAVNGGATER